MAMDHNAPLLYERGLTISAQAQAGAETYFYSLNYDSRSHSKNMAFPHFHSYYELMIPFSTNVSHFVEGKRYELEPYDVVLLAPSVLHQSVYPPGPPSDRLIVGFRPPEQPEPLDAGLRRVLACFRAPCPVLRLPPERQRLLFAHLDAAARLAREEAEEAVRALTVHTEMMSFLLTLHRVSPENQYTASPYSAAQEKIYAVSHFIHTHYSEELSLSSLAATFYLSPYYLSRRFHEVTGYTITQYIQRTRVKNAQYLLLHSDRKIADIAQAVGFSSFSQFNRVFRALTGTCPTACAPAERKKFARPRGIV